MALALTLLQHHATIYRPRWFEVLTPGDSIAVLAFAPMALAFGRLKSVRTSSRAKKKKARRPRSDAERLYEFTRETTQLDLHRKPGPQLAVLVQSIFNVEAVAIFDVDLHETYQSGDWFGGLEDLVRNVYFFETVSDDTSTGIARRVLRVGNLPIGALLLRGETSPLISDAIACIIAITFDRYHALANESRTEAARQIEQLRATVLDSLAHAYKTPLTAIRAASTGLSEMGSLTPAQTVMVGLIEEQSGLLNQLTTRLLKTARLEAQDLNLHTETVAVSPLLDDVVSSMREQLSNVKIKIVVLREDLLLRADRDLLAALLTQYIDNAGKYANEGTAVTIQAIEHPGQVIFSVNSMGPVIPVADYERIFDRYFRSSIASNKAPGTGIGLSVAKRAAQAHGGHVWVTSSRDNGTTFFASLPASASEGSRS